MEWRNSANLGVIEILSSDFKLGRMKRHEDTMTMAPALVSYTYAYVVRSISSSVWGCRLIYVVGSQDLKSG